MTREEVIDIHMLLATFRCFHEQLYTMKGKHTKVLKMKFKRLIGVARAYENEILKLNNNQDDLDTIYDAMMEVINDSKQLYYERQHEDLEECREDKPQVHKGS